MCLVYRIAEQTEKPMMNAQSSKMVLAIFDFSRNRK